MTAQVVKAEENPWGESEMPLVRSHVAGIPDGQTAVLESHQDSDALNLFLQKPSAASPKLGYLAAVAATADDSKEPSDESSPNGLTAPPPPADGTRRAVTDDAGTPVWSPAGRSPWTSCSPQSVLQEEQFSKMVADRSSQWFSLLPRSPCDQSSVTSGSSPANSASSPVPVIDAKSPPSSSVLPCSQFGTATPPGIKGTHTLVSQVSRRSYILHHLLPKKSPEILYSSHRLYRTLGH